MSIQSWTCEQCFQQNEQAVSAESSITAQCACCGFLENAIDPALSMPPIDEALMEPRADPGNPDSSYISLEEAERAMLALGVITTPENIHKMWKEFEAEQDFGNYTTLTLPEHDEGGQRDKDIRGAMKPILELNGLLDGPGNCPICHCNGWIGLEKHASCVKTIHEKANHTCHCGKPSTTIRYYEAMCQECDSHEAHLDALCD